MKDKANHASLSYRTNSMMNKSSSSLKNVSHSFALFLMRPMTEDEANYASLPCAFQDNVVNALTISAVVPLRDITSCIGAGQWTTHLNVTDTSATFEPSLTYKKKHKFSNNYNNGISYIFDSLSDVQPLQFGTHSHWHSRLFLYPYFLSLS